MALVKKYPSLVTGFVNKGDNLYAVEFKSECGIYKYSPGQFLHLALDEYDPSVQWPESRCFSMQSAPCDETIKITFSVKGVFTNRMKNELFTGKKVTLKLPFGNLFEQTHSKTNTVFIAGGTGLTPFLSLFTNTTFGNYVNPVLYAGFRNRALNIYHNELKSSKTINPSFRPIIQYEDETGMLDIKKILSENLEKPAFFISGPPLMIKFFKTYLMDQGVNESNVLNDNWE